MASGLQLSLTGRELFASTSSRFVGGQAKSELASGVAFCFDRALTQKFRKEKAASISVAGLESPLCNEVILSNQWKLEKVWRWKKPSHINIQEALAAERLFKQEAILRPKTRFSLIMDSNVGLLALAKGR